MVYALSYDVLTDIVVATTLIGSFPSPHKVRPPRKARRSGSGAMCRSRLALQTVRSTRPTGIFVEHDNADNDGRTPRP